MYNYDNLYYKWFEIENINGITVSQLFLNEELTIHQFDNILGTLKRIHNSYSFHNNINIYENYVNKLKKRLEMYDYSKYNNYKKIFDYLIENLTIYENKKLGQISVIHGDSVFSNILINNFGKIKCIDMRGKQNDVLTIHGDKMYDYAKIYQSIIGYDEILENKQSIIDLDFDSLASCVGPLPVAIAGLRPYCVL